MNRKMTLLGLLISLLLSFSSMAQETENQNTWQMSAYVTTTGFIDIREQSFDFIRGNFVDYENYSNLVDAYSWNASVNLERELLPDRISIAAGLQYKNISSSLNPNYRSDYSFMMINISDNLERANYIRVKAISQNIDYLGLNLSVRAYLFNLTKIRPYLKVGSNLSFTISDQMEVDFLVSEMSKNKETIEQLFDAPTSVYTVFNTYCGVSIGNKYNIHFDFEMGPSFLLYGRPSNFGAPLSAFDVRLGVGIPFSF